MKRVMYILLAGIVMLGAGSCSKNDPAPATPTISTTPEAKPANDNKSGGVYKGTFIGQFSSGTIKFVLQDGKTEGIVTYNGVTRTLSTTALSGWTSGSAITAALFKSTDWEVTISVDANGGNFDVAMNLAGTSLFAIVMAKEFSTAQVRVYEGTYAGDAEGRWNFCTQSNLISGVYSDPAGAYSIVGTFSGTAITISAGEVTATGTFGGEMSTCSGAWTSTNGDKGTWTGTRKI